MQILLTCSDSRDTKLTESGAIYYRKRVFSSEIHKHGAGQADNSAAVEVLFLACLPPDVAMTLNSMGNHKQTQRGQPGP